MAWTGAMEKVVAAHPDVAECAVVAAYDALKGQVPRAFVVLKATAVRDAEELDAEIIREVRDRIGPIAALRDVQVVAALPKTRSGKILRASMRSLANGDDTPAPATIDDPAVLESLRLALRKEN